MPKDVPMYVMTGFLESGKTHLIKDLLMDPDFTQGETTLLIVCEEGEEEYPEDLLKTSHTTLAVVEDMEELTYGFLAKLNKKIRPDRVMFEYNGTWPLADKLLSMEWPAGWGIGQIIMPVDANTFDVYLSNMRQLMAEHIQNSDLIIFNRCTQDSPCAKWWQQLKLVNRDVQIVFEDANGNQIEPDRKDILPYNLDDQEIALQDDDFGIWYVDIMNYPNDYKGKTITFTGLAYRQDNFPFGYFVPGRHAMTCCANDIQFLGFLCKSKIANKIKKETWVKVTARIEIEYRPEYQGEGPVLHALKIEAGTKPAREVVQLG